MFSSEQTADFSEKYLNSLNSVRDIFIPQTSIGNAALERVNLQQYWSN